jgi:hemolysin III
MQVTLIQPTLRGVSHHIMFFVSIFACALLIYQSNNSTEVISTSVYSIGILSMFGFSALYHRKRATAEIKKYLRKLDHSGIFLMIAGTFTPICLLALPKESGLNLLIIIWSVAAIGIIQAIFFSKIHRILRAAIYLAAGWVALPFIPILIASLSAIKIILVVTGGIVYTVGAAAYGFRFPKLAPDTFGFHEFFHILVIVAAILHFIAIYSLV